MSKLNVDKVNRRFEGVVGNVGIRESGNNLKVVSINQLKEHPFNKEVFRDLSPEEMGELKESIELLGQLEPLAVVPDGDNEYLIISGHQRKRAMEELGKVSVAVNVFSYTEEEQKSAIIHANIKQRKLSDVELAKAIKIDKALLQEKRKKAREGDVEEKVEKGRAIELTARRLGINVSTAKRLDRLNHLTSDLFEQVEKKELSLGKAQVIALIPQEFQEIVVEETNGNIEELSIEKIKKLKSLSKEKDANTFRKKFNEVIHEDESKPESQETKDIKPQEIDFTDDVEYFPTVDENVEFIEESQIYEEHTEEDSNFENDNFFEDASTDEKYEKKEEENIFFKVDTTSFSKRTQDSIDDILGELAIELTSKEQDFVDWIREEGESDFAEAFASILEKASKI